MIISILKNSIVQNIYWRKLNKTSIGSALSCCPIFFRQYLTHGERLTTHLIMKHLVLLSTQVRIEQKRKEREEVLLFLQTAWWTCLAFLCCVFQCCIFFSCISNYFLWIENIWHFVSFFTASFELMRKEQHKSFQEKQKLGLGKSNCDFGITSLLEDSKDEKRLLNRSNKSNDSVIPSASDNDSENSSFPPQSLASRPLVPPGFNSTVVDRTFGAKSVNHPHSAEVNTVLLSILYIWELGSNYLIITALFVQTLLPEAVASGS